MATQIMLKHPKTGIIKKGFYGFSWTTFFFGGFPAIFRGDLVTGLIFIVLQFITCGISGLIWSFVYNKKYTLKLLEEGYEFFDKEENIIKAKASLGIVHN